MAIDTRDIRVKISENGRIVVPVPVRKALGVDAGDEIILRQVGDNDFRITTQHFQIAKARKRIRTYTKKGSGIVDELIRSAARQLCMSRVVLDSSAILAYLLQEAGHEQITRQIIAQAVASSVNVTEVHTKPVSSGGIPSQAWVDTLSIARETVPFDYEQARLTGHAGLADTTPRTFSRRPRLPCAGHVSRNTGAYSRPAVEEIKVKYPDSCDPLMDACEPAAISG